MPGTDGAAPGAAPGGRDQATGEEPSALKPFTDFFQVGKEGDGDDIGEAVAAHSAQVDLQFLVATVPDPINSRFAYRFDGIVDSIEMAVESRGWYLDQYWLPWDPSGEQLGAQQRLKATVKREGAEEAAKGPVAARGSSGLAGLLVGEKGARRPPGTRPGSVALHEFDPGVLIFRRAQKAGCEPQVLVVLLVGETPTAGVHKRALFRCLNIIYTHYRSYIARLVHSPEVDLRGRLASAAIEGCGPAGVRPLADATATANSRAALDRYRAVCEFRIIGPSFSGSERSLAMVISQWAKSRDKRFGPPRGRDWRFRVITGCAVKIDRDRFITAAGGEKGGESITFYGTVTHFDDIIPVLFSFLMQRNGGVPLGKVALLTESDTEFGKIDQSTIGAWRTAVLRATNIRDIQITQMRFPFHVSQVAIAYDKEGHRLDRSAPSLLRPSSRLTIPFDETGSRSDAVPALSPQMTTATDEFVLGKILEMISLEDFRYVGIVATDTRDTIFLAGLIHQYCPDVQVFAPIGDLLLAHPRYSAELRGMILASTYPLFSMVQRWDPPYEGERRRHLFASQDEQGTFNAALWMLLSGQGDCDQEQPPPRASGISHAGDKNIALYDALFDYGPPFDELRDFELFWFDGASSRERTGKSEKNEARERLKWRGDSRWSVPVRSDRERPPIWISMVGQHGPWPLQYTDQSSSEHQLYATHADYLRKLDYQKQLGSEDFARQFVAFLPQFTWQWGAIFVCLSAFCWMLIWSHVRRFLIPYSTEAGASRRLEKLLGIHAVAGAGNPTIARMRMFYVGIGWLVLLVTYCFFAIRPCWIVIRYSPWAVLCRRELWQYLRPYDRWHWGFSAFAIGVASTTYLIIVALGVLRIGSLYRSSRNGPGAGGALPAANVAHRASLPLVLFVLAGLLMPLSLFGHLRYWGDLMLSATAREWGDRAEGTDRLAEAGNQLVEFERLVNVNNGVSPLVPVFLLALISGLWVTCQLIRLYYCDRFWEGNDDPFAHGGAAVHRIRLIKKHRDRIRSLSEDFIESLAALLSKPIVLLSTGLLVLVLFRLMNRTIPSVDFGIYTYVMNAWIWFLVLTVVISLFRFYYLWKAIEDLFRVLTSLPMLRAYGRVPLAFSRTFGRYLGQFRLTRLGLAIPVQQWIGLARGFDDLKPQIEKVLKAEELGQGDYNFEDVFARVERSIKGLEDQAGPQTSMMAARSIQQQFFADTSVERFTDLDNVANCKTWIGLRRAALDALHILVPYWRSTMVDEQFGEPAEAGAKKARRSSAVRGERAEHRATRAGAEVRQRSLVLQQMGEHGVALEEIEQTNVNGAANSQEKKGPSARDLDHWMRNLEDLVALRVVAFTSQGAIHLRNLAAYLALAPVLLLLAVSSYPLQPQRFMIVFLWVILLIVVVSGVTVVIQMEHNEFLSRVSRTKPNKIAFDPTFVMNVLAFILPLMVATLAQFPFVSDTILQWIEPITRVLR